MESNKYEVWKSKELVEKYLKGVRGAIPLAEEQLDILLRIIKANQRSVNQFLDLGCGDGILAATILRQFPSAKGILLDLSEVMIDSSKEKLSQYKNNLKYVVYDYGKKDWGKKVEGVQFDLIVSGYSIHHQTNDRKKEIYSDIYKLLSPTGMFINIEHVSSPTKWVENLFDECFIDSLFNYQIKLGTNKTREQVAEEFYSREDHEANILAPVNLQCEWLRNLGFEDVDCYFKLFEFAIFGGRKPKK